MNNENSKIKDENYSEDEYEVMNNKNRNFEFEFDMDKVNEYFIKGIGNIEDDGYEEIYQKGFKDGYDKAKQEVLAYLEKNKYGKKQKTMRPKKY